MISPRDTWTDEEHKEIDDRIALSNSAGCELSDEFIEGLAMFATTIRAWGVMLWTDYQTTGDERLLPLLANVERVLLP